MPRHAPAAVLRHGIVLLVSRPLSLVIEWTAGVNCNQRPTVATAFGLSSYLHTGQQLGSCDDERTVASQCAAIASGQKLLRQHKTTNTLKCMAAVAPKADMPLATFQRQHISSWFVLPMAQDAPPPRVPHVAIQCADHDQMPMTEDCH